MCLPSSPISILPDINKMVPNILRHCLGGGGEEVRGAFNKLIRDELQDFFNHVEWTYTVHLLRDGEPTALPSHCTPSNEEAGDVFGPLQNK